MDTDTALGLLRQQRGEIDNLQTAGTPEFEVWRERTLSLLQRIFHEDHRLPLEFGGISWRPPPVRSNLAARSGHQTAIRGAFASGKRRAIGLLEGAIFELEVLTEPAEVAGDTAIDPELWDHVGHLVQTEQWAQVASQTAIFVESKVREWAGRP